MKEVRKKVRAIKIEGVTGDVSKVLHTLISQYVIASCRAGASNSLVILVKEEDFDKVLKVLEFLEVPYDFLEE